MREFTGNPAPLTTADHERAAKAIGCAVAAIRAVAEVESRGGFLADGRPKILFERHIFSRLTNRRFDTGHPAIANPAPGGYRGGPAEYDRLAQAIALDRPAALKSASWGAFQIMGFNHNLAGFTDVEIFVKAMVSGQGAQLDAFARFIKASSLGDELIRKDWPGFARGYNGPDYAKNKYDIKLAAAFVLHDNGGPRTENPRLVLRMGDRDGPGADDVKTLQTALGLKADGDFGPGTKAAVIAVQKAAGLYPDGVVGQQTWLAILN
jgi:hypothetical protein